MSLSPSPKVSILLPNLNARPFLEDRMDSIVNQTYKNWELIIVDGYSDDGSWKFFQEFKTKNYVTHMQQSPREGIYKAINKCLSLSSGEYIYIATSDDTMSVDCLEKMVAALKDHKECGLAHCCLTIIDEQGKPSPIVWDYFPTQQFYGEKFHTSYVREAPIDGLLYFGLGSVYTSLTQLLIRKSVFDNVGVFKNDWGAIGDVEWCMRVSLTCDAIHVPEYLATWRKHEKQATPQKADTLKSCQDRIAMAHSVLEFIKQNNKEVYRLIQAKKLFDFYEYEEFTKLLAEVSSPFQKFLLTAKNCFLNPRLVLRKIVEKIRFVFGDQNYMGLDNVSRMKKLIYK